MGERFSSSTVIIAIDPSKSPLNPLRLGVNLARHLELPAVLVTVFAHHPLLAGPETEDQLAVRAGARQDLLDLGRSLDGDVVADALVLASSSPARALHELGETTGAALIVVGSTTRGALRRVLPGSVAQQLLSGAACPVAVAPNGYNEQQAGTLATVGVAFDGSAEAERALDGARHLARKAHARLRIITVVERLAFGAVPVSTMAPAASARRVVEAELRSIHEAALANDRGVECEGVFREGNPADVLIEQSHEVDLLLAGSRGYGPLSAVLLGSTTRELTREAGCPLIIIPRGHSLDLGASVRSTSSACAGTSASGGN